MINSIYYTLNTNDGNGERKISFSLSSLFDLSILSNGMESSVSKLKSNHYKIYKAVRFG